MATAVGMTLAGVATPLLAGVRESGVSTGAKGAMADWIENGAKRAKYDVTLQRADAVEASGRGRGFR